MIGTTALTYPEFTPGTGKEPPYLAGREAEQAALCAPLSLLRRGEGANSDIIVIGPRGNGKTVLLDWFRKQCKQENTVATAWLTPAKIKNDFDELIRALTPPDSWKKFLPMGMELGPEALVKLKWEFGGEAQMLTELLKARCRERPLVVLLDEAHTLDKEIGFTLLNVSQKLRQQAPLLLVLGGTPGLQYQLNDMSATFWNRSEKLGIGLLNEADARDALLQPFNLHKIRLDEAVLETVVDAGQRYPYFLQCWGEALTGILRIREQETGVSLRRIDAAVLEQARPEFNRRRNAYYEPMREELEHAGLLGLAAWLTRAYDKREVAHEGEVDTVIRSHLSEQRANGAPTEEEVSVLRRQLAGFGYIWRPPSEVAVWHSGIPSLMSHVLMVAEEKESTSAYHATRIERVNPD
ncbi:MAG: ATP-binding protein [Gammaproteobacteria bacterium]|nr:ATP-binding protein [Gammaproteobacteria bacterium]